MRASPGGRTAAGRSGSCPTFFAVRNREVFPFDYGGRSVYPEDRTRGAAAAALARQMRRSLGSLKEAWAPRFPTLTLSWFLHSHSSLFEGPRRRMRRQQRERRGQGGAMRIATTTPFFFAGRRFLPPSLCVSRTGVGRDWAEQFNL
jgi:hypothetical protein